ncbi:uncharacterized protein LOC7459129 isoform X6 [Populus trichocarpa]|uniref:Peptidase S26 domain-containing protein n=1 Tax=Populus trichocarpa TaxID=3694 RepID=A0A3N7EJ37_POPTR|nr:uncharacterized protein LOC7459129 isoform X6 [Populus trichocarpa]|eukprot:XP_024459233.1 mitochondrial inner membrane protease subunit 1 isoform X6 [Populus trichocarpa]
MTVMQNSLYMFLDAKIQFCRSKVYGPSMLPTLNLTGDVLLVEHVSHRFQKVPKGHIWIQGDNMYASCDSRHYGPVPYGLVQGKLFFRVWPPSSFGSFGQ